MLQALDLAHGSLCETLKSKFEEALAAGALIRIETDELTIGDGGVDFLIWRSRGHYRKPAGDLDDNPFLPAEPALYLGDINNTHYCVLNKYSVIDRHLLIVTRQFESQETLLHMRDFIALSICMRELDGLAFYNAGRTAGASQSHKHIQMVPLPLTASTEQLPIMSLLSAVNGVGARIRNVPNVPFSHAFGWLSPTLFDEPRRAGEVTYDLYVDMMESLGMGGTRTDGEFRQPVPYNLLVTRHWMLLVPRVMELGRGLSINALAFAGSLFVRSDEQLESLREHGPMVALSEVCRPRL